MTDDLVSVQGWPLNTGKNNEERETWDCYRVAAYNTGNKYNVCMSEKSGLGKLVA